MQTQKPTQKKKEKHGAGKKPKKGRPQPSHVTEKTLNIPVFGIFKFNKSYHIKSVALSWIL